MLRAEGANFTRMYGEEHFSEGNYFWLLSGSNQDVGYFDEIPPGSIDRPSLGGQLFGLHPKEDRSFRGYAKDLPGAGQLLAERDGHYARKHVPYVSFLHLQRDGRDRRRPTCPSRPSPPRLSSSMNCPPSPWSSPT